MANRSKSSKTSGEEAAITTTEYILSDANVGMVFPEIDGYCLSLVRSRGANDRGRSSPNFSECHFVLRNSISPQNLFCIDSHCQTPLRIGGAMYFLINAALQFHGELRVVSVPLGSEWELTLSDVFVPPREPRKPAQATFAGNGMFGAYPSYRTYALIQRSAREPKPLELPPPALQIEAPIEGERMMIERDRLMCPQGHIAILTSGAPQRRSERRAAPAGGRLRTVGVGDRGGRGASGVAAGTLGEAQVEGEKAQAVDGEDREIGGGMISHYGQYPIRNWHYNTPYPQSGPMDRQERDFWLELVMLGAFLPPAGPKEPTRQARLAPPLLAITGPSSEEDRQNHP